MRRAVIYGIGEYYLNNKNKLPDDIEIIAYADSSEKKLHCIQEKFLMI